GTRVDLVHMRPAGPSGVHGVHLDDPLGAAFEGDRLVENLLDAVVHSGRRSMSVIRSNTSAGDAATVMAAESWRSMALRRRRLVGDEDPSIGSAACACTDTSPKPTSANSSSAFFSPNGCRGTRRPRPARP